MKKLAFCEYCIKENEFKVHKVNKTAMLKDQLITYTPKEAICKTCGKEIYIAEVWDYNIQSLYEKYREKHNIIKVNELQSILKKYNISSNALSKLLGWSSETLNRYLEGDMPLDSNSEILKKINENANDYLMILKTNEYKVSLSDYNISRQAVKEILNMDITEEKIDSVIQYILIRYKDVTPSILYKLLYYIQGFYYIFTNKFMFDEDCEAFVDGPVYRSLFERYKKFGYEDINKEILANDKLQLEDFERNVVEGVIKYYSCYSGKILRLMTCNEAPWILTRKDIISEDDFEEYDLNIKIEKKLISGYFNGIKEKYGLVNLLDIEKYSKDLFDKISM